VSSAVGSAVSAVEKHWTESVDFGSNTEWPNQLFALWATASSSMKTFFAQAAAVSALRLHGEPESS
jgi:hypothetical protein